MSREKQPVNMVEIPYIKTPHLGNSSQDAQLTHHQDDG